MHAARVVEQVAARVVAQRAVVGAVEPGEARLNVPRDEVSRKDLVS